MWKAAHAFTRKAVCGNSKGLYTEFVRELSKCVLSAADWCGHLHNCDLEARLVLAAMEGPGAPLVTAAL